METKKFHKMKLKYDLNDQKEPLKDLLCLKYHLSLDIFLLKFQSYLSFLYKNYNFLLNEVWPLRSRNEGHI